MLCAIAALALCSCSKAKTAVHPSSWKLQGAFPGAYLHVPPMPSATASPDGALPLQITSVRSQGGRARILWDAPDAISATILFSAGDGQFRRLLVTQERSVTLKLPQTHGVLRIAVTDGKRWSSADARI